MFGEIHQDFVCPNCGSKKLTMKSGVRTAYCRDCRREVEPILAPPVTDMTSAVQMPPMFLGCPSCGQPIGFVGSADDRVFCTSCGWSGE